MAFKHSKPVIGLAGGIGSGKSTIARQFGSLGCVIIDSDQLSREVIELPEVREALAAWLGPEVIRADGTVDRRLVGACVFTDAARVERLNGLIHPRVKVLREKRMPELLADPKVRAIVWDAPLLFEAGLHRECDAVVFIKVRPELRLERLQRTRGWGAEEVARREKFQFPLDKKQNVADYCIDNSGDEASSLLQVQRVLSQILAAKV